MCSLKWLSIYFRRILYYSELLRKVLTDYCLMCTNIGSFCFKLSDQSRCCCSYCSSVTSSDAHLPPWASGCFASLYYASTSGCTICFFACSSITYCTFSLSTSGIISKSLAESTGNSSCSCRTINAVTVS